MRYEVKILWFDDDTTSETVPYLKEQCIGLFNKKGYICSIEDFSDYDNAFRRLLNNERIDIIFTDFNVIDSDNKDGVTFYLSARQNNHFKQHIALYSTDDQNLVRDAIKQAMDSNNLSDFSNFSFFKVSLIRPQDALIHMEKVIDIYLSRWRELNALRGRTMNEHADLEYQLKTIIGQRGRGLTYEKLIEKFKSMYNDSNNDSIFNDWDNKRKERNDYAHVEEGLDDLGYFIKLRDGSKIYEIDIEAKRIELRESIEKFQSLIDDYNRKQG